MIKLKKLGYLLLSIVLTAVIFSLILLLIYAITTIEMFVPLFFGGILFIAVVTSLYVGFTKELK